MLQVIVSPTQTALNSKGDFLASAAGMSRSGAASGMMGIMASLRMDALLCPSLCHRSSSFIPRPACLLVMGWLPATLGASFFHIHSLRLRGDGGGYPGIPSWHAETYLEPVMGPGKWSVPFGELKALPPEASGRPVSPKSHKLLGERQSPDGDLGNSRKGCGCWVGPR